MVIRCGKGTYIRSIAHDLGAALAVHGHLVALRRVSIGPLLVSDAVDVFSIDTLPPLRPPALALPHLPGVTVEAEIEAALRRGRQEWLRELAVGATPVASLRLLAPDGRLVSLANFDGSHYVIGRMFN